MDELSEHHCVSVDKRFEEELFDVCETAEPGTSMCTLALQMTECDVPKACLLIEDGALDLDRAMLTQDSDATQGVTFDQTGDAKALASVSMFGSSTTTNELARMQLETVRLREQLARERKRTNMIATMNLLPGQNNPANADSRAFNSGWGQHKGVGANAASFRAGQVNMDGRGPGNAMGGGGGGGDGGDDAGQAEKLFMTYPANAEFSRAFNSGWGQHKGVGEIGGASWRGRVFTVV